MRFSLLNLLMILSNKRVFEQTPPSIAPSCKDCIFYMVSESKNGLEKCKKYGEIDDFTGQVVFYELEKCRGDELRCGSKGIYFIKKDLE